MIDYFVDGITQYTSDGDAFVHCRRSKDITERMECLRESDVDVNAERKCIWHPVKVRK